MAKEYTDTELLDWLASVVYLPEDTPHRGVFVVIDEDTAPYGTFTGNDANDAAAFRKAIVNAIMSS